MNDELTRIPSREEVKACLARYFAGSVPDEQVDGLIARVVALLADEPRRRGQVRLFATENQVGWGEAWREELAAGRSQPTPLDHALLIAATSRDFPSPLPYCPTSMVGDWELVERERGEVPAAPRPRWLLRPDGTMRAKGYQEQANRWRVHRGGEGLDRLWLTTEGRPSRTSIVIASVGADEMRLMSLAVIGEGLVFRRA